MNRIQKKINYINWNKESEIISLTKEDMVNKIANKKRIPFSSLRDNYDEDVYSVRKVGDYLKTYLWDKQGYKIYITNTFDDTKNSSTEKFINRGTDAIKQLSHNFKNKNNVSLLKAFGTTGEQVKRCIPKQFAYYNKRYLDKNVIASSIDGCSQYPSGMCGKLPNSNTAITVKGRVKPTEEYPFAFYIKSGHIAEYGKYDTHEWLANPLANYLFRFEKYKENWPILFIDDNEEETMLMKASDYELTSVWEEEFNIKQTFMHDSTEYQSAKLIMNASIGMMHQKKYDSYKYAHLAAVAIARGNAKILELIEKIGLQFVIQVCVDGIIYIGETLGSNCKKLGEFYQEFTDADFKISAYNKYIAMYNDVCIKAKHGNCNKTIEGHAIIDEEIKNLDDQYKWILVDPLKELLSYGEK